MSHLLKYPIKSANWRKLTVLWLHVSVRMFLKLLPVKIILMS